MTKKRRGLRQLYRELMAEVRARKGVEMCIRDRAKKEWYRERQRLPSL